MPNPTTRGRAVAAAIAAVLLAASMLLATGASAAKVFSHGGWQGYVVEAGQMGGCRMSHPAGPLHAIVHITRDNTFLIGFVDTQANFRTGEAVRGRALFDGRSFSLSGSADNPSLVTFGSDGRSIVSAFRSSKRMRIEWGQGGWVDISLVGSSRALDLLRRCASYTRPASPPLTSYAPSSEGRVYADTDLPGFDYRRIDDIVLSQCMAVCAADSTCRGMTHNGNADVCFLKYGFGGTAYHRGATSWVK